MSSRPAVRAWERHLEEVIGVADAETVVDRFDNHATHEDVAALRGDISAVRRDFEAALDARAERLTEQLTDRLSALWRRDLLLIITGQFVAIAGVLTAVT